MGTKIKLHQCNRNFMQVSRTPPAVKSHAPLQKIKIYPKSPLKRTHALRHPWGLEHLIDDKVRIYLYVLNLSTLSMPHFSFLIPSTCWSQNHQINQYALYQNLQTFLHPSPLFIFFSHIICLDPSKCPISFCITWVTSPLTLLYSNLAGWWGLYMTI